MAVSSYRAALLTIFLVICFYVNYLRVVQREIPAENSYIQTGISRSVRELFFPTAGDSSNEYIPGHIRGTETATKARSGETQPGNLSANNIPNHFRNTNTAFPQYFTQTLLKTSAGHRAKEKRRGARSGNTSDVNKMWNTEAANISERPGSRNEPDLDLDTAKQANRSYGGLVKNIYYRKVVNALTLQSQDQPIPRNESITLVTQCSKDRLDRLRIQAHYWNGPISSAVYLDRKDRKLATEKHVDDLKIFFSKGLKRRAQITFSFVLANVEASGYNTRYPINTLRNLAVEMANTSEALFAMKPLRIITPMNAAYIFVLDVDFIPSLETYQILHNFTLSLSSQERLNSSTAGKSLTQAYVVPAFKMKVLDLASFPNNFTEAARQYKSRLLASFQNGDYHAPTNYKKWFISSVPYTVEYKEPYEPFLVLRKNPMPRFDERFRGYGRNKVAFVQELAAKGYSFIVIPRCFVVHLPHKKSPSSKLMDGEEFMKIGEIYERFKAEIRGIRTGT